MTLRRDPNSASGAWFETCQRLGWGRLAQELRTPEATVRKWSDETSGKEPPLWAVEAADKLLKDAGHPPLNTIALGGRLGGRAPGIDGKLAHLEHEVDQLTLEVDTADGVTLVEVVRRVTAVTSKLCHLTERACQRADRESAERVRRPHLVVREG